MRASFAFSEPAGIDTGTLARAGASACAESKMMLRSTIPAARSASPLTLLTGLAHARAVCGGRCARACRPSEFVGELMLVQRTRSVR